VSTPIQTRMAGKVCVIAGAGGVIAEAVAARLEAEGAIVIGIDRVAPDVGFPTFIADLRVEPDVRETFERIRAELGRIDVLYNNAGPLDSEDHALLATSTETWERVFRGVLAPPMLACKYAVPIMLQNAEAGGSIINTGSFLAGMGAATAQVAYSAAKAAVTQLSLDLGTNLARSGIRVNVLALGPVQTPLIKEMFDRLGPDGAARRLVHIPTGRFATPDEVAGTVAYLASSDSSYVTASVFPIHGGIPTGYTLPE
jgi:NAD(P)-dependent dehydrogenase (short-subunit alcohol dehydrogenase family)